MNLLELRDRIRDKGLAVGLTYTEIQALADVNEVRNAAMPAILWNYDGESNDYSTNHNELTLDLYIIDTYFDAEKAETTEYQRDYIVTKKNELRDKYLQFLDLLQFVDSSDYLDIVRDTQIPFAEQLGVDGFAVFNMRLTIQTLRSFCPDVED